MMRHALCAVVATFAGAFAAGSPARACTSCGSGGDDPLILYPNETSKVYVGWSRASGFRNVGEGGALATAGGPDVKDTATVAAGVSASPRAFATVAVPFQRNARGEASASAVGDPSVAARYTAVMANFMEPLVPQVQAIAGYRFAQARSLRGSRENSLIDVFGTGFPEARAGVDVWWGMAAPKLGLAHMVAVPLARRFGDTTYRPGLAQRSTLSAGYGWGSHARIMVGVNREERAAIRADGQTVGGSAQLNHGAFATFDWMPGPLDTIRASVARQAALGANRNTARSDALTLAYMRAL